VVFKNPEIQCVYAAWRSAIKRIWGLHYRSHNRLVSRLSSRLPFVDEICNRSLLHLLFMHVLLVVKNVKYISTDSVLLRHTQSVIELNLLFYLLTKTAIIQLKSAYVRKSWTTRYN